MIQDAAFEEDIYTGNESDFVTDYAAMNEAEDIAESFAIYTMHELIEDDGTTAWDKVMFFEQFPELVALRTHIRQHLSLN